MTSTKVGSKVTKESFGVSDLLDKVFEKWSLYPHLHNYVDVFPWDMDILTLWVVSKCITMLAIK